MTATTTMSDDDNEINDDEDHIAFLALVLKRFLFKNETSFEDDPVLTRHRTIYTKHVVRGTRLTRKWRSKEFFKIERERELSLVR